MTANRGDDPESVDSPMPEDADAQAEEDATAIPGTPSRFGSLSPSEAARKRWDSERESVATGPQGSQTDHEKVLLALWKKAKAGDVAGARELREWLREQSEAGPKDSDVVRVPIACLTRERRAILKAWIEGKALEIGDSVGSDR